MKVFISADMEGLATTSIHEDCNPIHPQYLYHCEEMTKEVVAACEGAIAAGADEILIKDAHGPASNIDPKALPECCKIIRKWSGHPYQMVEGIDGSFDGALFVGYHNAASRNGNPLSHTSSGRPHTVKINGRLASEFLIFSYAAALEGVPTVYISGDKQLCEDYADLHPKLVSTSVKEGDGSSVCLTAPKRAIAMIKEDVEKALSQDLADALIKLPDSFHVEICYNHHSEARKNSFYPGAVQISDDTITFDHTDYFEVLRFLKFCL